MLQSSGFLQKENPGIVDNTVLFEKDKEIEVLKEKKRLRKNRDRFKRSLKKEEEQVKSLLKSVNKIEELKLQLLNILQQQS